MRAWRWMALSVLGMALATLQAEPARAQDTGARAERITIAYVEPRDAGHRQLFDRLRETRALETVQAILSPLRLPRALEVRTEGCDGDVNAWFDGEAIVICYEYIAWAAATAQKRVRPIDVPREAGIAGPFLEVALHEAAHALFDYLDVPILGREEDAADQMAALWLLSLGPERARGLIAGVANLYLDDVGVRTLRGLDRRRFAFGRTSSQADVHSTPAQRLYGLICLAYGAHPDTFADLVAAGALPQERAEGCADEHRQVVKAYRALIRPHVDQDVARRVYGAASPFMRP